MGSNIKTLKKEIFLLKKFAKKVQYENLLFFFVRHQKIPDSSHSREEAKAGKEEASGAVEVLSEHSHTNMVPPPHTTIPQQATL